MGGKDYQMRCTGLDLKEYSACWWCKKSTEMMIVGHWWKCVAMRGNQTSTDPPTKYEGREQVKGRLSSSCQSSGICYRESHDVYKEGCSAEYRSDSSRVGSRLLISCWVEWFFVGDKYMVWRHQQQSFLLDFVSKNFSPALCYIWEIGKPYALDNYNT